jgi:hypothetical protein
VIDENDIKKVEEEAERAGADYILLPFIRHEKEIQKQLSNQGYINLPWNIEAEIFIDDTDIDKFLYNQIGAKRFNEIKRLVRKAREKYAINYYSLSAKNTEDNIFCELHKKNINKYQHSLNPYDLEEINIIKNSSLSEKFYYMNRKDLSTNNVIQSSLNFIDISNNYMAMLVQGIDSSQVKKGTNLYITETYENYLNGFSKNIKLFNLGRGGSINKLNLGCNIFHVLHHSIKPLQKKKISN